MIRLHNNLCTDEVRMKPFNSKHDSKKFVLYNRVINLSTIYGLNSIVDRVKDFIDSLPQNSSHYNITSITHELKR